MTDLYQPTTNEILEALKQLWWCDGDFTLDKLSDPKFLIDNDPTFVPVVLYESKDKEHPNVENHAVEVPQGPWFGKHTEKLPDYYRILLGSVATGMLHFSDMNSKQRPPGKENWRNLPVCAQLYLLESSRGLLTSSGYHATVYLYLRLKMTVKYLPHGEFSSSHTQGYLDTTMEELSAFARRYRARWKPKPEAQAPQIAQFINDMMEDALTPVRVEKAAKTRTSFPDAIHVDPKLSRSLLGLLALFSNAGKDHWPEIDTDATCRLVQWRNEANGLLKAGGYDARGRMRASIFIANSPLRLQFYDYPYAKDGRIAIPLRACVSPTLELRKLVDVEQSLLEAFDERPKTNAIQEFIDANKEKHPDVVYLPLMLEKMDVDPKSVYEIDDRSSDGKHRELKLKCTGQFGWIIHITGDKDADDVMYELCLERFRDSFDDVYGRCWLKEEVGVEVDQIKSTYRELSDETRSAFDTWARRAARNDGWAGCLNNYDSCGDTDSVEKPKPGGKKNKNPAEVVHFAYYKD